MGSKLFSHVEDLTEAKVTRDKLAFIRGMYSSFFHEKLEKS